MRTADLTEEQPAWAAEIRHASTADDLACARALFVEYARWLEVDLCFQGFDEELATLPGAYAPPRGRLLLAGPAAAAFACIALRPLGGAAATSGEVKRLYVQPGRRGERWGQRLGELVIAQARGVGYRELLLDTLDWMKPARALYASLGFRECEAYYDNPLAGAVYMKLELRR